VGDAHEPAPVAVQIVHHEARYSQPRQEGISEIALVSFLRSNWVGTVHKWTPPKKRWL